MIIDNLYNGATSFLPSMRKVMVFFTFMCAFSMAYSQTYYLHVGEAKFLGIPYTNYVVEGSASWGCTHRQIDASTDDKESGVIITIKQYFSDAATISVTWTEEYFNSRTGHSQFTAHGHTWTIRCKPVNINLAESNIEMKPGDTKRLNYSWSEPSWASAAQVEWVSSDPSIATVEGSSSSITKYATITAKKSGNVTITANTNMGPSAVCNVTVKAVEPNSVSLPSTAWTKVGESVKLSPTLYPSDAETTYSWSSDNTGVATVSQNGLVSGKKVGTTNITVKTANGKSASCNVTVEKANVSVSIDTESGLYANGKRVSITASKADAKIYYTINGSTPTSSSLLYTAPITLNESLTLKAVAMGDNYNSSNILTRIYEVTSLAVVASESKNSLNSPYYVPFVTFNENIKAGSRFQDVKLLNSDNVAISGEVLTQEKTIYFSPTELLPSDTYTLEIPEKAITSESGQPNLMAQFLFTVGKYQTVSKVATGSEQSYVLKSDGTLWAAGRNTHGILGNGTKNDMHTHVKILDNVKDVSVGQWHVMALRADGSVWAWGWNYYHQLGKYEGEECLYPIKIFDDMDKIIAGREGSYAIKKDGTLWVIGSYADPNSGIGRSSKTPTKIMDNVKIIAAASDNHYLLIKEDDTLWAWGYNGQGQIGDGTHNNRLTPVKIMDDVLFASDGNYCSFAIKKDGSLWAWGANDYGQLGAAIDEEDKDVPVKIMDDVKMVSGGSWHNVAVKNDNTLWAWGWNSYGILGDGTSVDRNSPVKILENVSNASAGYKYSLAVKTDGTLWACGTNDYGQWGNGTTTGNNVPELVLGLKAIENVTFKETNINVQLNEKYVLLFNLSPADANISKVEFKSDNESVVSVSNHGVIQAKKVGTATITVTVDDTFTATCKVNVAETLGVGSINFEGEADDVYYDLQGRRVSKPTAKGVYIKNGKKVTIK